MTNTASTPVITSGRPNWSGSFSGRVALVTGASRGIGAAIAGALAAAGASVVLAARDEAALAAQVIDIRAHGGVAVALVADVTSEQSVRGLLAEVRRRVGRLDIAVNNAAGGARSAAASWTGWPAAEEPAASWSARPGPGRQRSSTTYCGTAEPEPMWCTSGARNSPAARPSEP